MEVVFKVSDNVYVDVVHIHNENILAALKYSKVDLTQLPVDKFHSC